VVAHIDEWGPFVSKIAVRLGEEAALGGLVAAVADEASRRGAGTRWQLCLPHTPELDAAIVPLDLGG